MNPHDDFDMHDNEPEVTETRPTCKTCGGIGFGPSPLGPDRCAFCDGQEAGLDPFTAEVPTLSSLHGIPAIIGTCDEFPMTGRTGNYMGISREEPAPAPKVTLDPLQAQAIEHCDEHLYTNISGTAGVGKTFVAKEIVQTCEGVTLAATTGIASVNLGEGTTINALLGYFNTVSLKESYLAGYLQHRIRKLRRAGVQRILIDEKSMMAGEQLTYITRAVREVNEGGVYALESVGVGENEDDPTPLASQDGDLPPMGITLVGDFGQLPPVPDEDPATGKKLPVQYCFDSPEWAAYADHTTTLTKIFRQDAQEFVRGLHAVRRADVMTAMQFFTADRFSTHMDDQFIGSTIFAKNESVDRHNMMMLDALKTTPMLYRSVRAGKQRGDWRLIPDELRLKETALVMILANSREYDDDEDDRGVMIYANGDLGELVGKSAASWQVKLQRTGKVVNVFPVRRENTIPLEPGRRKAMKEAGMDLTKSITEQGKGKSEVVGTIVYMPLRAAYGCTVHKTQGLTLDRVQVNLRDPFFRMPGMLFVALSRCRTAEGLRIVGDQLGFIERCRIEPRVQPWL